jgi:hypothetical protein
VEWRATNDLQDLPDVLVIKPEERESWRARGYHVYSTRAQSVGVDITWNEAAIAKAVRSASPGRAGCWDSADGVLRSLAAAALLDAELLIRVPESPARRLPQKDRPWRFAEAVLSCRGQ